jgi:hypothetical protein
MLLDFLHLGSSETAVARRLLRLYLAQQEGWVYDAKDRCLKGSAGGVLNLPNLVHEYSRTRPWKRRELLRRWVRLEGNSEVPDLWVVARGRTDRDSHQTADPRGDGPRRTGADGPGQPSNS